MKYLNFTYEDFINLAKTKRGTAKSQIIQKAKHYCRDLYKYSDFGEARYYQLSYNELIILASKKRTRQRKYVIAMNAKSLYPNEYNRVDFFKKRDLKNTPYEELIKLYYLDDSTRGYIMIIAKTRKEFKKEDFPRKSINKENKYISKVLK
jgi:hypothetical protein